METVLSWVAKSCKIPASTVQSGRAFHQQNIFHYTERWEHHMLSWLSMRGLQKELQRAGAVTERLKYVPFLYHCFSLLVLRFFNLGSWLFWNACYSKLSSSSLLRRKWYYRMAFTWLLTQTPTRVWNPYLTIWFLL